MTLVADPPTAPANRPGTLQDLSKENLMNATIAASLPRSQSGWCQTATHSRFDHLLSERCDNPVTDEENTAQLLGSASGQVSSYDPAAAYVDEWIGR